MALKWHGLVELAIRCHVRLEVHVGASASASLRGRGLEYSAIVAGTILPGAVLVQREVPHERYVASQRERTPARANRLAPSDLKTIGRQRARVRIGRVHVGDRPVRVANGGRRIVRVYLFVDETCTDHCTSLDRTARRDYTTESLSDLNDGPLTVRLRMIGMSSRS